MGIEGAFVLGETLGTALRGRSLDAQAIRQAFAEYESLHRPRVEQCARLTALTSFLAAPASAASEGVRNGIRYVPEPINSAIFDICLEYSLGERPASTRALWEETLERQARFSGGGESLVRS